VERALLADGGEGFQVAQLDPAPPDAVPGEGACLDISLNVEAASGVD
jgi:hypothetical protein